MKTNVKDIKTNVVLAFIILLLLFAADEPAVM